MLNYIFLACFYFNFAFLVTPIACLTFKSASLCPTPNYLTERPQTVADQPECSLRCSLKKDCDKFYFDSINALCYLGDACNANSCLQWTPGPCKAFQYAFTDSLTDQENSGSPSLLKQLKMKLFYRFIQTGLSNEANPRFACLRINNASMVSDGVLFEGYTGSNLSTETPGFERFLDNGHENSAFVRFRSNAGVSGLEGLHLYHSCNGSTFSNAFRRYQWKLVQQTYLTSGVYTNVMALMDHLLPNIQKYISVGVTFNGTMQESFFSDGTLYPISQPTQASSTKSSTIGDFQCLYLGIGTGDNTCLKSSMQCYGLSAKVLSESEFRLLEQYCLAA